MKYLSESYSTLKNSNRDPVNYGDPATRFAYVYKYVAAHGDYLVQILKHLRDHLEESVFSSARTRISCIGGGPGSDIIACLKYLDEMGGEEPVEKVVCYLLDREQAWADTWTELGDSLNSKVSLNVNFQPLDVSNPQSWKQQKKFLDADLFTMSYFVSEVMSLDSEGTISEFWATLFEKAKPGALFVYDDNGHDDFNKYFDGLSHKAGLENILSVDNTRLIPRLDEQAAELKFYTAKFGQSPKIQSYLSYRVLRKPVAA